MLAIKFRTNRHGYFIAYVTCYDQNVYAEIGTFQEVSAKIKEHYERMLQRYQI